MLLLVALLFHVGYGIRCILLHQLHCLHVLLAPGTSVPTPLLLCRGAVHTHTIHVLSLTHPHTQTHTHAHTHARTHAHTIPHTFPQAVAYFKRYYIHNSILIHPPQSVMLLALFVACKAEKLDATELKILLGGRDPASVLCLSENRKKTLSTENLLEDTDGLLRPTPSKG